MSGHKRPDDRSEDFSLEPKEKTLAEVKRRRRKSPDTESERRMDSGQRPPPVVGPPYNEVEPGDGVMYTIALVGTLGCGRAV